MRILIVGAGIAGLALAKALEQRGMEAELIERQPEVRAAGAGLFLPGNAVRAIARLELFEAVTRKAVPIKRQLILDSGGKVLNEIDTDGFWHDCGPCLSLPRQELQEMLEASVKRSTVTFGRSVAKLAQDSKGCSVTFDDGAVANYDLVVGADGIHSTVREAAALGGQASYVGLVCWRHMTKNSAGRD